ncbi:E3 ubiquitin-protein ligase RING1-like [Lycium ferocissimum]|uniref:E3 ubiquitin-protein ligase RING1-like n=1 Tax=Lycium ferocissimum TaxID=112874 RepID=UPI002815DAB4|nr:E3 ubiquitin-protein ligase RING1-like [Lycium ferocissimum]
MDDEKEKEEDVILGYFETRTHHVVAPKDGVKNATLTEEAADKESADICAICQAKFEHEETIGTLQCGHEYHTHCIKQWLMRKKNCPMCRASVLPFTSTNTIETDSILGWVVLVC